MERDFIRLPDGVDVIDEQQDLLQWKHLNFSWRNLRLIANIQDPSYALVAAKAETGITDLSQIREKLWPVRILTAGIGRETSSILAHYGLSREMIEAAGGRIGSTPEDTENFDIVIGEAGVMTTAPEWSIWTEITQKFDLHFIGQPEDLLARLAREGEAELGTIPVGLYRGVVRPIPTVVRTGTWSMAGPTCRTISPTWWPRR